MMNIRVNGETREVPQGITLSGLLGQLGIEPRNLAIEHNGEFINEQSPLDQITVKDGDTLEIVRFVGGG